LEGILTKQVLGKARIVGSAEAVQVQDFHTIDVNMFRRCARLES
jgi:hypothetical protein